MIENFLSAMVGGVVVLGYVAFRGVWPGIKRRWSVRRRLRKMEELR